MITTAIDSDGVTGLLGEWAAAGDLDVAAALQEAQRLARGLPPPGHGATALLWSVLATIGSIDLTAARAIEPHLDAAAIHAEADLPFPDGSWGVFAAEQPGSRLDAEQQAGATVLTGAKPWCSLADRLDRALVTAWEGDQRRLFAVDLHHPGVTATPDAWHALGLAAVPSGPVRFESVTAVPVGDPGWYLERPGFAWGGIGVAAVWFGGASGLARSLLRAAAHREPDQFARTAIGRADRELHACRVALSDAARAVDSGDAAGDAGALLAARVRGIVASAAETVLATVGHALGPAPLALDADHARRVADLSVYLRQHHAERDDAALGDAVLHGGVRW